MGEKISVVNRQLILKISFLLIAVTLTIFAVLVGPNQSFSLYLILYLGAFLFSSFFKTWTGIKDSIEEKSLNVEVLMILAAIGSFILGDYLEGIILLIIFSLSDILEHIAKNKAERTLKDLIGLVPEEVILIKDDKEVMVAASTLKVGDFIRVNRGEVIGADGIIYEGNTTVDEQMITGEYLPQEKCAGNIVYAGTINLNHSIIVHVSKEADAFIASSISRFVKEAGNKKSKSETQINKFEKQYVKMVILISIGLFLLTWLLKIWTLEVAFYRAIIVLVVGSPCAVVASITPAVLASLAFHAKRGVLIKGGDCLENLSEIDCVFLDKTGTLTKGALTVVDFQTSLDENIFKALVYSMELGTNHPIGKAIVNHFDGAVRLDISPTEIIGIGMQAYFNHDLYQLGKLNQLNERPDYYHVEKGYTYIYLTKNNQEVGFIALSDEIRPEAHLMVDNLKKQHIKTLMLTGDHEDSARLIAGKLGIESVYSSLMPEDKYQLVKSYMQKGHKLLMTGDGMNDAISLKEAHVGVAMQSGTDIALDAADVVLVENDLSKITLMLHESKRFKSIYRQNLVFSLSVIMLLLISNIFGLIFLPIAVLFHEGSTILVILNSLRLLR